MLWAGPFTQLCDFGGVALGRRRHCDEARRRLRSTVGMVLMKIKAKEGMSH
jgi:hypothetical protein